MSDDFGEETIEAADDPPRVFCADESYPGCAFTRSLGDTIGKSLGVSAEPELLTYQLDQSVRCLVIGSDGVFEFMENEAGGVFTRPLDRRSMSLPSSARLSEHRP
jgi:serine/threonine protein phosphatase PrpC